MQNYRNNAMPYNMGCGSNFNGNYRHTMQPQAVNAERRTTERCTSECISAAERCTSTCEATTSCMDDMVLAMAYVKWQKWQKIYDAEKALHQGTIFEELDLPFCGIGGCQK